MYCILIARSKDVRLPVQLQRAMAAEAEAAREARAKVIPVLKTFEFGADYASILDTFELFHSELTLDNFELFHSE